MSKKRVVADAGGSKTAWAILESGNLIEQFETSSLHPRYALQFDEHEKIRLKEQLTNGIDSPLSFYGAGCSSEERKQQMHAFFTDLGFPSVDIFPDTIGACRAALGNNPGFVAILGTGSVLLDYNGKDITQQIGGHGAILGDEGSGLYFAKLLVKGLLEGQIEFTPELLEVFESKDAIRKQLSGADVLPWLSSLAGNVAALHLRELHEKNFQIFVDTHLLQLQTSNKTLHVIGTYGCKQQAFLREVLDKNGWELGQCIEQPIFRLVEYHLGLND
jgi:glucosamine kinase